MPTLDKYKLDTHKLDSWKLDMFKLNAYKLDGASGGGIDAYTKVMLHFNGTNGSTTFTDAIGKTWTAYNGAALSTAQIKFGTASGFFDGTDDYIDTPDHADFDVGSGDFTFDTWVRLNADGINQYIYSQNDSSGSVASTSIQFYINSNNKLTCRAFQNTTQYFAGNGSATLTADGNFHHVALVRSGNTLTIFQDGVPQASVGVAGATLNNSIYKPTIGRFGEYGVFYFNGWIDEFRFSKGIARWSTNFTPPTSEYTA